MDRMDLIPRRQGDIILLGVEQDLTEHFRDAPELKIEGETEHTHRVVGAKRVMVAERPVVDLNLPVLTPNAKVIGLVEAIPGTKIVHDGGHKDVRFPQGNILVIQQQEYRSARPVD